VFGARHLEHLGRGVDGDDDALAADGPAEIRERAPGAASEIDDDSADRGPQLRDRGAIPRSVVREALLPTRRTRTEERPRAL
jgi:hypothetical protein